jgi:M6 family metalloprotease-like protein
MSKKSCWKSLALGCRFAWLTVLAGLLLSITTSSAAPMNGLESPYTQPDGTIITLKFFGDEFYARTETADGYTVVFDPDTKTYYFAALSPDGKELLSTGQEVGKADPAKLGIGKSIKINPESRAAKAKKRYAELEAVVQQEARWKAVKEASRKYHEFKKRVKEQEKAGKKGFVIPLGTIFPDSEIPATPLITSAAEGDGTVTEEPPIVLAPPSFTITGNVVGLTILVDFSDDPGTVVTQAQVDDYCNKPNYTGFSNAGSIYDYFSVQSGGNLRYNNNVTYYVRVPQPKTYYNNTSLGCGTCGSRLLNDALNVLLANGYDFSKLTTKSGGYVRACNVLFAGANSGVWSYGLWPHRSGISAKDVGGGKYISDYQITDIGTTASLRIGTVCHENGHMLLGYPDLYSYDGNAAGVGNFSLMASSGSTHPVNIDSYLKEASGWMDVIDLNSTSQQRCTVQVDGNQLYRYRNPLKTQEYFLFEVRDNTGYEGVYGGSASSVNPSAGLVAYHVLETGSNPYSSIWTSANPTNSYSRPYELLVVEANQAALNPWYDDPQPDGNDAFKSTGKNYISDNTTPALKFWDGTGRNTASGCIITNISPDGASMTFVVGAGVPSGSPNIVLSRSTIDSFCAYGGTAAAQTFTLCNGQGGTLSYTISDDQSWLSCSPATGTATNEIDTIVVSFSTSGLAAGSYSATITVTDPGASPTTATITVNLTVNAQPILFVSRTTISENGLSGMNGPQVSFAINNAGGGAMTYSLSKTQSWLTLSSTNGAIVSETDTIYVTLDSSLLASGAYNDTITITSPEAANSPRTIPVSFSVNGADIVINSPNGGETLSAGTQMNITWGSSIGGTVSIVLLKNGFSDTLITSSTANDGSYSWTLPNTKAGSDFKIRITSLDASPGFADESNGSFIILPPPIYETNMDANPAWTLGTGWAYGQPTGAGQDTYGNPDPTSGYDGPSVIGYQLDGDYEASIGATRWATTPAINCSTYTNVTLRFQRWLGVEDPSYDHAYIEVSSNGVAWVRVWENTEEVDDSSWVACEYDLSAVADKRYTVYVRWGMGTTDSSWQYCGWNLDAVKLAGDSSGPKVSVAKSGGSIDVIEGGATDTYTVVLGGAPTHNVVITVTPDSQVSVNTPTLTFTTGNWASPQTVTVTAVNDGAHEMNHFGTITHSVASMDPTYNGVPVDSVLVSITDNDNSAPTVDAGLDQTVLLTGGVWSPAFLSPLAWYDANDAATLTQSSGVVSQWNDKSGRSNHLAQATSTKRPLTTGGQINGLTAITFDGTDDELRTPANPFGTTISNACVTGVFNIGALGQSTLFSLSGSSATANRWQSHSPWDVGGVVYFDCGNTVSPNRLNYTSGWVASQVVLMGYYCSVSDSVQEVWEGGTKKISDTSGHAVTTAGGFAFGSAGAAQYDNVKIGETVVINGTLPAADRQSLEGYLAHKWGLAGTLPANHAYKTEAPSTASAATNLNGTVTDADNDPVTTLWSVVSGPGPVVFADTMAVDTVANFKVQGVYTLRLSASDGVLQTTDDVVITVTTNALPVAIMAPTGLSAGAGATNRIDLAWTDNSANETGFVIERSATSGSGFAAIGTAAANATTYLDSTVSAASTYYYRVSATNTTASSTPSAEASATTPKIPAAIILSNLSQTYNGTARTVTSTTAPTGLAVTLTYNGRAIAPTNTGSYAVTGTVVSATYAGSTNGTLMVSPKSAGTFTIANVGPFTYDGAAKSPEPQVNDGATVLVKNTHYTLSYTANTNAGVATVTVTGIGNYTGTQAKNFTISPATLTVTPTSGQSKTYGAANPTLTYNNTGTVASETAGFSGALSRATGESIGSYAITQGTLALAANGAFKVANYTLSFTPGVTFAITPRNASTLTIAAIAPFTYDGSAKRPEPEVKDGLTVLTKGVDYSLSYANNTLAGTATLTVTGMGNYTGTQNKSFTINKVTPTINPWPTGTVITAGQPLSASTLSGGSASVSGTFTFDAPSTVPPVGVCTAAVTFAATDSVNYAGVNGTCEVTVKEAIPPAPTSLTTLPSVGQVALSWTPSAGASGYNVKRAATSEGAYSTIASPAGTNFVDSGLSNGTTYYYRVSALNAGGESTDSGAGSALIPYGLPFVENFEGLGVGSLDGQNGWSAVDAIVQTATARGTQAANITSAAGYLQHAFEGAYTNVWTDFMLQPVFFEGAPPLPEPMGTVNFYFNNNGHPVVYDGTTPVELSTVTVTTGAWIRVTVRSDYVARKWTLYVNASLAAANLAFYATEPLVYTRFEVSGAGSLSVALDDLSISLLPPWPLVNKGTVLLFMLE